MTCRPAVIGLVNGVILGIVDCNYMRIPAMVDPLPRDITHTRRSGQGQEIIAVSSTYSKVMIDDR